MVMAMAKTVVMSMAVAVAVPEAVAAIAAMAVGAMRACTRMRSMLNVVCCVGDAMRASESGCTRGALAFRRAPSRPSRPRRPHSLCSRVKENMPPRSRLARVQRQLRVAPRVARRGSGGRTRKCPRRADLAGRAVSARARDECDVHIGRSPGASGERRARKTDGTAVPHAPLPIARHVRVHSHGERVPATPCVS